MKLKNVRDKKGMLLVGSYLVLSLLGTFSFVIFAKDIALYRATERTVNRILAFHLAESGLDQAIAQLRNNLSYTGQDYTAWGRGGYDVQVSAPDPVANPNLRLITTNGYTPNNQQSSYAYERRQVTAYVDFPASSFTFSIFSDSGIQINGNSEALTDSYDSRIGPYHSQIPGTNGDIGTNAVHAGAVQLSGNVNIGGDVVVGAGGEPTIAITTSGDVTIQGTTSAAPTLKILEPVTVPSGLTSSGDLTATGSTTLTYPGGTYWFSSIQIAGNGKVNFTGAATVYVTGSVNIAGRGVGTAQDLPPNLTINVAGNQTVSVSLSGNAGFYGTLYAPDSPLNLSGNGEIFGALASDTLHQSGRAKIHYDEALSSSSASAELHSILRAWIEN